ncbi:MAG: thioesterase-like protein [Alphaproteobacteria bacterium]|jgi:acyl-CoA thioester hydrolase|nr:thioesterase-like protein [Alphaproteobacteria bacterium]|tara:strand:+ start:653 stop:1159 length:507 start_codon:yes stop_codon:yes gene_type:complete
MNSQSPETAADISAPLELHTETVQPDWIDYNGHMNLAYYMLAFDHATDAFFDYVGLGEGYLKTANCSTFTLEAHITYDRELMAGAPMRFETQLLAHDAKRLHYIHFMYHAEEGYLASANELISLHVDMDARRSAPMPEQVLTRLDAIAVHHDKLPHPEQAGRVISIVR